MQGRATCLKVDKTRSLTEHDLSNRKVGDMTKSHGTSPLVDL